MSNSGWEGVTRKLESMADEGHIESSALAEVAVAAIHPLFKNAMTDWEPLQNPEYLIPYLSRLGHVLGVKSPSTNTDVALQNGYSKSQSRSTTLYETMIYTFWLPPVRSAITNDWDPHDPTPLRALITTWEPLLPAFILTSLFDNIIVQRLTTALQAWVRLFQPLFTHSMLQRHSKIHIDKKCFVIQRLPESGFTDAHLHSLRTAPRKSIDLHRTNSHHTPTSSNGSPTSPDTTNLPPPPPA